MEDERIPKYDNDKFHNRMLFRNDMEILRNKRHLLEMERGKLKKISYIIGGSIALVISLALFLSLFQKNGYVFTISGIVFPIIIGILCGIMSGTLWKLYKSMALRLFEYSINRELLRYEVEHIQNDIQDVFENSIRMSYKYLDQYYLQTREQAQNGFFVTVCVSVVGALLLAVGIVAMFLEKTEPSYITCASGVVTEFIAAIFFYLYNKTVASMSKYHNKLVLSQNISIALKVADTLPSDDKTKSKNMIISELLKDINIHLINSDSENGKESNSE